MRDKEWYIGFLVIATLAAFQVWALLGLLTDRVTGKDVSGVECSEVIKARLELLTSEQRQSVGTTAWGEYSHRIDENLILLDAIRQDGE
jgi:hypothetical protein